MPDVSANAVPVKKAPNPITWGPIAAVSVTVVIWFLAQLVGSVLILSIAHARGWNSAQITDWAEQVGPQFFYIAVVEAVTLGLLWLFLRNRKATFRTLGLVRPHWKDLGYVFIGFAIYLPVLIGTMALIKLWFPQINFDQQQQVGFHNAHGVSLIPVFVSLAVLPPITEEILTRGFLFLGLRNRFPVIPAAILTSIIFASAHLQAGSGAPLLWTAAVDTFILSLVLVFLRVKTGCLWSSIGLHMVKNSIAFAVLFVFIK